MELSRNNYIHLPIPNYFSPWQIPSPGFWRHKQYHVAINFIEIGFRCRQICCPTWRRCQRPSTQNNSPVNRTHPYGYNFFVQFYPYGLDFAAGNHASILFALFPGDYDGLLTWPFPNTIHFSVRNQPDPQKKWTITFAPSKKISFRRLTREPCPTLMNAKLKTSLWIILYIWR